MTSLNGWKLQSSATKCPQSSSKLSNKALWRLLIHSDVLDSWVSHCLKWYSCKTWQTKYNILWMETSERIVQFVHEWWKFTLAFLFIPLSTRFRLTYHNQLRCWWKPCRSLILIAFEVPFITWLRVLYATFVYPHIERTWYTTPPHKHEIQILTCAFTLHR